MTVRFALLGAGRIGKTHAQAISANPNSKLVAVYDPNESAAQEVSRLYGCEQRSPVEIASAKDVDVVAICTPTTTHADFIELYAAAHKVIFCEKPIDLDLGRVSRCLKVVKKHNAQVMLGFNRRFDPHFEAVQQGLRAGKIGAVEQVIITSRDPALPPMDYISVSGGLFYDMMIHDFDMARFLLGEEIECVYATGSVLIDREVAKRGDIDTAMAILTTASGKQAHINCSRRASYGYDQRIEVHGETGMLQAHNPRPLMIEHASNSGYNSTVLHDFFMTRYTEAYAAEITALIAAVKSGAPLSPSADDGLMALVLAQAALLSMQQGRAINVRDILDQLAG